MPGDLENANKPGPGSRSCGQPDSAPLRWSDSGMPIDSPRARLLLIRCGEQSIWVLNNLFLKEWMLCFSHKPTACSIRIERGWINKELENRSGRYEKYFNKGVGDKIDSLQPSTNGSNTADQYSIELQAKLFTRSSGAPDAIPKPLFSEARNSVFLKNME